MTEQILKAPVNTVADRQAQNSKKLRIKRFMRAVARVLKPEASTYRSSLTRATSAR